MSTSITQATNIVADAVGVRVERVRQVARRLVEDGHLPKSAGRYIADIGGIDIIKLLLAAVADTRLPDVSGSMRALFDLRCATGRTLGHALYELLATVQTLDEGAEAAVDGLIEIEAETPRATIKLNFSPTKSKPFSRLTAANRPSGFMRASCLLSRQYAARRSVWHLAAMAASGLPPNRLVERAKSWGPPEPVPPRG